MRLKQPISVVTADKTLKSLVGGKSAVQNEIVAEIEREFKGTPDGCAEMPLSDVADAVAPMYAAHGKVLGTAIGKLAASVMPAGFGIGGIKGYLGCRGLGSAPNRVDTLLAVGLTAAPAKRLADDASAHAWLDGVCDLYGAAAGVSVPAAAAAGGAGSAGAASGAVSVDPALLKGLTAKQEAFIRAQMEACADFLGEGPQKRMKDIAAMREAFLGEDEASRLPAYVAEELGEAFVKLIRPSFSAQKVREYDSAWAWARLEAVKVFAEVYNRPRAEGALSETRLAAVAHRLASRASEDVADILRANLQRAEIARHEPAAAAMRTLLAAVEARLAQPAEPAFVELRTPSGPAGVRSTERTFAQFASAVQALVGVDRLTDTSGARRRDAAATRAFHAAMAAAGDAAEGLRFTGTVALLTGAGPNSMGAQLVGALLAGGATVIVTTSRMSVASASHFQRIYQDRAAGNARLLVVPCNQGSVTDLRALIDWVYADLGLDLDFVIPFGAISEQGVMLEDLGSRSEAAFRIMLTNIHRLIGMVKKAKADRGIDCRPAHVILPCSPNHGNFGGDGFYAESKAALETLNHRWASESCQDYLTFVGAVIGWVRGTGLMAAQDTVSAGVEAAGVRTFSQSEMAFMLMSLMDSAVVDAAAQGPLMADLSGGFEACADLRGITSNIREAAAQAKANARLAEKEAATSAAASVTEPKRADPGRFAVNFPALPTAARLESLPDLRGMHDLSRLPVIVGTGELSSWGNTFTRWQREVAGKLSTEAVIHLAWLTGRVKYFSGKLPTGAFYAGWVDAKTKVPVPDHQMHDRYEEALLATCGIRVVDNPTECNYFHGYHPHKRTTYQFVVAEKELPAFTVADAEEARAFKKAHGDKCSVVENADGSWRLQLFAGAEMLVPKQMRFGRDVIGQIPTGYDPTLYGIPADLACEIDPVTHFVLIAVTEALLQAGILDPYELYEFVHASQVGNSVGSGIGGGFSLTNVFHRRKLEQQVSSDALQETFVNTVGAWLNMLILSSSGPLISTVAACATSAVSMDVAATQIRTGKAKVMVCGGVDDYGEEAAFEFSKMKATVDNDEEALKGRFPSEACRPSTSSRSGFVEGQGAGIQIVMAADVAIRMGCPVYAIVGHSHTASDREGRSVPAPGQGVLTSSAETAPAGRPALRVLDVTYRRRQLQRALADVARWEAEELEAAEAPSEEIKAEAAARITAAQSYWSFECFARLGSSAVSPFRAGLASFGLTADDLFLATFHNTSTNANDKNEPEITHLELERLGRTHGLPLPVISQKQVTGHAKGGAAGLMCNGAVQAMLAGIVPPNWNGDNFDSYMRRFPSLLYTNRAIDTGAPGSAVVLNSFGFGQAGAQFSLIHPDYLWRSADLTAAQFAAYAARRAVRERAAIAYWDGVLSGRHMFIGIKNDAPYSKADQAAVLMDAGARATATRRPAGAARSAQHWRMTPGASASASAAMEAALAPSCGALIADGSVLGVGVDVEAIGSFPHTPAFVSRNFTEAELQYCGSGATEESLSHLAGRWCAKEAVVKALCAAHEACSDKSVTLGSAAPLADIEVLHRAGMAPLVELRGHAAAVAAAAGVKTVAVSISHSGDYAIAQATVFAA
jgi:phosphopantetheine--protein transferase-like protein